MEQLEAEVLTAEQIADIEKRIKNSIGECFRVNTMWKPNNQLVLFLYKMLRAVIIDKKKYIFLKAPTGSGKSIVGFAYSWSWNYFHNGVEDPYGEKEDSQAYFLTSSKALQAQLQGDIDRFKLDEVKMLKGRVNYECTRLTEDTGEYHTYLERWCKNKSKYEIEALNCYDTCPYLQARLDASLAGVSILNYWYFLSAVRKLKMIKDADGNDTDEVDEEQRPPLFGVRPLTICDESHLISDIIIGMYNITLTIKPLLLMQAKINNIKQHYRSFVEADDLDEMDMLSSKIYGLFLRNKIYIEDVYEYEEDVVKLRGLISKAKTSIGDAFDDGEEKPDEDENNKGSTGDYLESLKARPDDLLIETTFYGKMGETPVFSHNVYDMDESMLARKYFLSRMDVGIFMSATLPPFHEYAYTMGISKNDYVGFTMTNGFDFSKSPIVMQSSGYLNHKSFKSNIKKVLWETLILAECDLNRNVKGIIHTGTFEVSKLLQEMITSGEFPLQNKSRYLFYANSAEKEELIKKMKSVAGNYIICGPSLYEGIDLKDDFGRINFLVKVPYQALTAYTEEKMKRMPFWYNRTTINKIEQSIGRTNRHINDWSRTYLMDSLFNDIIFDCDEHIVERLVARIKM